MPSFGDIADAITPHYDDQPWRTVDVPHDYAVEGDFAQKNPFVYPGMNTSWYALHGFLPEQPAMYRREIDIPAETNGKRLWLEFDGVFSNSHYWLKGREIGSQYSGYTRSRFDITEAAEFGGRNELAVKVDPRYDGWWYEGAGIYRHVRLVMVDPVHIAPDGIFVAPAVAEPGEGVVADATVVANTEGVNSGTTPVTATIRSEILDAKGQLVAEATTVRSPGAGAQEKVTQQLALAKAALWSLESPYLYHMRSAISVGGKVVDAVTTPFGVRQIGGMPSAGSFSTASK